ncbi:LacI family DNA-binding transcriptional regulator [Sphingomonas oligophenolica]|uniref:LacI family DNA-binding transcriptional regulator n=1 Tax=Sphingomonas oligophenolica TaxID=301154 RepID=UPI0031E21C2D
MAQLAGVSSMTVSRVVNGNDRVHAATRKIVNAAIATLNYVPSSAARTLAGVASIRLGLLCSNPSTGYLSDVLLGSLEQASRAGAHLVVERCRIGDHEADIVRHLLASGVDGVILPPPLCDSAAVLDVLAEANIPVAVVASAAPASHVLAVMIDDFRAAFAMTDHLIALGHERIGFIAGHPNLAASDRRLAGYRAAVESAGIAMDDRLIANGLFTYRSGLDATEMLLNEPSPPSAIFACNDDMAAAAVAMAHRRGLDVPADLTVCGFDDTRIATAIWPALTTIHQPTAAMARTAVELLAATIRGLPPGDGGGHRTMDFTLVRRQSDSAPRRRPAMRAAEGRPNAYA